MNRSIEEIILPCWECDAETDQPVKLVIRTRASFEVSLLLCPSCYRACCVPLESSTAIEPIAATLLITSAADERVPVS